MFWGLDGFFHPLEIKVLARDLQANRLKYILIKDDMVVGILMVVTPQPRFTDQRSQMYGFQLLNHFKSIIEISNFSPSFS